MTLAVHVAGSDAPAVTTALAIEVVRGRPTAAMVGAQVEPIKPRKSLRTTVVDTTLRPMTGPGDVA